MQRTSLAGLAALVAVSAAGSAIAAAVGPPSGVYFFGDLHDLSGKSACLVDQVVYSVWFGAPGSNIDSVASVLQSNGAGAAKFSTAIPFVVNEATTDESFNIRYGAWTITTFNPGSATTGTIVFDRVVTDPGAPTVGTDEINFKNYSQTFDSRTGTLILVLTAEFPHCSVDLQGVYQQ